MELELQSSKLDQEEAAHKQEERRNHWTTLFLHTNTYNLLLGHQGMYCDVFMYTYISRHCVVTTLTKSDVMSFLAQVIVCCVLHGVLAQCFFLQTGSCVFKSVSTVFNVYRLLCLCVHL